GLYPFPDNGEGLEGGASFDRHHNGKLIGSGDPNEESVGAALNCSAGNRDSIFVNARDDFDRGVLPRPKCLVFVGEQRFQTDGTGGLIALVIDYVKLAVGDLLRAVLAVGHNGNLALAEGLANRREIALGQRKDDGYRMLLCEYGYEGGCVVCPNDIAGID